MIDTRARLRLQEDLRQKAFAGALRDGIVSGLKSERSGDTNNNELRLVVKKEEDTELVGKVDKLGKALVMIYEQLRKPLSLPKVFFVKGIVDAHLLGTPTIKVQNLADLGKYFQALDSRLAQMTQAISMVTSQKPQAIKIDAPKIDMSPIAKAIEDIHIPEYDPDNESVVNALTDMRGILQEILVRPQMTPNPVSHVSINSLKGFVLTTQIQLGGTVTPMPGVPLINRRSWQLFNNGVNTIYFGGANVTAANGIPVSAGAFSDIIDAGPAMTIYAISASGQNNDVRLLEVADEGSGR